MTHYSLVLYLHSYLRWVVVVLALVVLGVHARAWLASRRAAPGGERLYVALIGAVDLQFSLGLILYFLLSPISAAFFHDPGHAVHEHTLRFFGLEHAVTMTAAVAVLHVGRARSKRAPTDRVLERRITTTVFASFALIASAIPWPGLRHGRPLFRVPAAEPSSLPGARIVCPPLFAERCIACHGPRGAGDGIAAVALEPKPRNFRAASWGRDRTDADLAAVIGGGGAARGLSAAMPAQPDLSPEQTDSLVRCVRSLHAAGAE